MYDKHILSCLSQFARYVHHGVGVVEIYQACHVGHPWRTLRCHLALDVGLKLDLVWDAERWKFSNSMMYDYIGRTQQCSEGKRDETRMNYRSHGSECVI